MTYDELRNTKLTIVQYHPPLMQKAERWNEKWEGCNKARMVERMIMLKDGLGKMNHITNGDLKMNCNKYSKSFH